MMVMSRVLRKTDRIKDHVPPNIPMSRDHSKTSAGEANNHTETAEYGINPHPPSDDDKSYQNILSFLHISLEINPMDYEISEEKTHSGTDKKMAIKNNTIL